MRSPMVYSKWIKRLSLALVLAVLVPFLALYAIYSVVQYGGNFHAIEPGQVYRSAQVDKDELATQIQKVGVKSILNLRGGSVSAKWYAEELATAQSLGVAYFQFPLSAGVALSGDQMQKVLALIEQAPKPILIHCNAGADRTGLVAAIYLANQGASMERVQEALSLRYGHFPYLHWSSYVAMDHSLEAFLATRSSAPRLTN